MSVPCQKSHANASTMKAIIELEEQQTVSVGQGSNLTFELNSQMASTCSGFTSHKRVSSSLGTSVQHKIKKNVKNPVVIKR